MKTIKFAGNDINVLGEQVKVGDKAIDFTVTKNDFSSLSLSEFAGKNILLTVFPSVDTSVCAMQTKRFNLEASKIEDLVILSISVDLPPALDRFCASEGIDNLVTTSDYKTRDFATKYGFLLEGLYLLARGNVLINKEGIVTYVEYVEEVTTEPNYDLLLAEISKLS